jgi:Fe-Mn family superoxide dismutase
MTYKLPQLPYHYNALEPHIDTRTMEVHHGKHHLAYVNNLNMVLKDYPTLQEKTSWQLLGDLANVPKSIQTAVRNNAGGHANHSLFWNTLSPRGGGVPGGDLGDAINDVYGSFINFREEFSTAARNLFGSGWVWLCVNNTGQVSITTTANQDNPYSQGSIPLFGLDVWEHAYYLKYENRRTDYIAAFWNIVNWGYIEGNYDAVRVKQDVRDAKRDLEDWADRTWSKLLGH